MFRPAAIQPMHGERAKATLSRIAINLFVPLFPVLRFLFPHYVVTTEELGRAMLRIAGTGATKKVLESSDIRQIGK
jgi:hypothetical protein